MKKIFIFAIGIALCLSSCKKDDPGTSVDLTKLNNGVTTCLFAPYSQGSTFTYDRVLQNGSMVTSVWEVTGPKIIDGDTYASIDGLLGVNGPGYFNCNNGEYTMYFENTPTVVDGILKLIYLKENAAIGTKWNTTIQQFANGISYTTRYEMEYIERLSDRPVNGIYYIDVIHNQLNTYTTIAGTESLVSVDDYYWAQGVGLIEVEGTNGSTKIVSLDVK